MKTQAKGGDYLERFAYFDIDFHPSHLPCNPGSIKGFE